VSSRKFEHLNRPLGYEIATLLIESALSFEQIKRALPYENPKDGAVNRILNEQPSGHDLFTNPKTRDGRKHTLNTEVFSDEELAHIRDRSAARISDTQPTEETAEHSQSSQPAPHVNAANMKSRFL
jgi:hypothetical protein